ncbi:MAG: hypothetical protein JO100_06795 [Pseudonocardia sp.]|nr:hypothetical protein [Pseudonocardia sp.]
MSTATYLADTSIYVLQGRHPKVRRRFETLLIEGRLAACQMTALEYLNNAPDPAGYEILWRAMHTQRWLDISTAAMDRALGVPASVASHLVSNTQAGRHRAVDVPGMHRQFGCDLDPRPTPTRTANT